MSALPLPVITAGRKPHLVGGLPSLQLRHHLAHLGQFVAVNNIEAAGETRREAFTKYFPQVSASFTAFKTHNDVLEYDFFDLITVGLINKGKMAGIQACVSLTADDCCNSCAEAKASDRTITIKENNFFFSTLSPWG